jgi:5'-nucleotidase
MTLILTNDDGVDAPGIRALLAAVDGKGVIVAPQEHHSGCGHLVTTTSPIQVEARSPTEYAIRGTPVDCVRLALNYLCPESQWVFSGINHGGNMGADVYISGTVAAVREAALYRIPAIAISHYRHGAREIDWDYATHLTKKVLMELLNRALVPGTFWNVNLPHLEPGAADPQLVFCRPCTQPLPANYRVEGDHFYYDSKYFDRKRDMASDVEVCFSGQIAVTLLGV